MQKIQNDNLQEPICLLHTPEIPWWIIASDIFYFNDKECLLIADRYSGWLYRVKIYNSVSVIRELKQWFSVHGIPDILQTDKGNQYVSEQLKNCSKSWNFKQRLWPLFARSYGLAERYVKEAKNLLGKCGEESSDFQLALLHHRNTPRGEIDSPA